ncbi:hypothetical protein M422DRAFT_23190 [Sphaerobolus stellatus SS14]|nr:hypothetical protein M422DRAFT_23190 [Sphaerobolus stellatus SS14]
MQVEIAQSVSPPSPKTLGRLWRQSQRASNLQRSDEMTRRCNLEALKRDAGEIMNKTAVEIHKFGEGGFNQVFIIVFDDGSDIVARVNCSRAEIDPEVTPTVFPTDFLQYGVASEAATLNFLREKTSIPVPTVYAVNVDPDNAVGMRYVLQERIIGQHVSPMATKFSEEEQERFFKQVIYIEKQLLELSLPSIGSLMDDPVTGKCVVGALASLPLVPYYDAGVKLGPWHSSEDLLKGYARHQYEFIVNHTIQWEEERLENAFTNGDGNNPPLFSFFETFYRLYMEGVQQLHFDKEVPFVLHELDLNDFLVAYDDPTRIVGVVDWQSTYALPMWYIVFNDYPHIRNYCATKEAENRWSALRTEIFKSIPSFEDAAGREYDIRRHIFGFLRYWKSWSVGERELFRPLLEFIKSSEYSTELMDG